MEFVGSVGSSGAEEIPKYSIFESHPRRTLYCVAVVVWNEGERIRRQLGEMAPNATLADIVVADGASDDGSLDEDFLERNGVRSHLVTEERGLGTALRMAFSYALSEGYDGVVTVDGNGKDGVGALPNFLERLDKGGDLVQGSRFIDGGRHESTPFDRLFGIRFIVRPAVRIRSGFRYTDPTNGFRALSRRLLSSGEILPLRKDFVHFNLQLYLICEAARRGFKVEEVPVSRVYPADGSVPTKITSLRSRLRFFKELLLVFLGSYQVNQGDCPEKE